MVRDLAPDARRQLSLRSTIALLVLLGLSGLSSLQTSFHPGVALAKLAVGLVHFAAIGWATARVLSLERPRHLSGASYVLLGQIVGLAYIYFRSAVSGLSGLPGISVPEVMLVEGLLLWFAFRRSGTDPFVAITSRFPRIDWRPLISHGIWLSGLLFVALEKLDLLYTGSSDPDIHAFYTKMLIERGQIYYDLKPLSDAWMVYPSGFACLNLSLGLVSGLHPVQLVNIGPHVQFTLFCGAAFSVISQSVENRRTVVLLSLFHFAAAYLCFNPLFAPGRELLQGTPRLAHSAILFFPLFFVAEQWRSVSRRPLLLSLPLCAVAVGMCINPTHLPAALLFGTAALAYLLLNLEARNALISRGVADGIKVALLLSALLLAFFVTDPFYRSLLVQQSAPKGQVEEAHDLTGNAMAREIDLGKIIREVIPESRYGVLSQPDGSGATVPAQVSLLLALVAVGLAAITSRRLGGRAVSSSERNLLAFAALSLLCVLLHAIWSELTPHLARPGVLQGRLLVRYSQSLQYQISTLFYSLGFSLLVILVIGAAGRQDADKRNHQLAAGLAGLAIAVGSLACLVPASIATARSWSSNLRETSLGVVYPSDLEFARRARERVGPEERLLLPGNLRQIRGEHWIFSTGAGRAIPLFSDIRTSFFLGLDGSAFTAGAYQAHVQPPNFDPVWLRSHNILWLVESGNFSPRILRNHYRRIFGDAHAVLWRLRAPTLKD